jgi:alpha-tubulin suppressor-like RCC1 family protein
MESEDPNQLGAARLPVRVPYEAEFIALDLADNHLCALSQNGRGYCWGRNYEGQLGIGTPDDASIPTPIAGQGELDRQPL